MLKPYGKIKRFTKDNGQLFYYPGSPKLPNIRKYEYDTGINWWRTGNTDCVDYENKLEEMLESSNLEKVYWSANPGEMLIWNAHFVHGGSPILTQGSSLLWKGHYLLP